MRIHKTTFLVFLVGVFLLSLSPKDSSATSFPDHELKYISWCDAGSGCDSTIRTLTGLVEKDLGQPIKVLIKTGGNGSIALGEVLKSPADGYTLSHWSASLAGFMNMPQFPAKPTDFDYLVRAISKNYMIALNSKLPIKNFDEFLKYAKENPGKLTISGSRVGSIHHQNVFFMAEEAGVEISYFPAKGGSAALKEALGGHVSGVNYTPNDMLPYVKKGMLRPIVIFALERDPSFPDTPTINEAGLTMAPLPQENGVMLKKGVPASRRFRLFNAFNDALETQEWKDYLKKTHRTSNPVLPDDFREDFLKKTIAAKRYLKTIGILK